MGASFGSGGSGGSGDDELVSAINITPLVDVVLVLLVIFLMTAPVLYQSAIKVKLPSAQSGEQAEKSPLNFTITNDGNVIWDKEQVDWSTLSKRLGKLGPNAAEQTAIISADEKTAHGIVIKLMDTLRQAGVTRFAMNVEAPIKK
jgi:biopolymer transport protein ExbD